MGSLESYSRVEEPIVQDRLLHSNKIWCYFTPNGAVYDELEAPTTVKLML